MKNAYGIKTYHIKKITVLQMHSTLDRYIYKELSQAPTLLTMMDRLLLTSDGIQENLAVGITFAPTQLHVYKRHHLGQASTNLYVDCIEKSRFFQTLNI